MAETTTRIYELQVKLAQESLAQLRKLQDSTDKIESRFASLTDVVKSFGIGLIEAFSVGVVAHFIEKNIEAAAAMDDFAERTGASVEELSKLQQVAKISGTDISVVETFIVKLNKALHGTDDEAKGGAKALAAIGLSIAELKDLDPAVAMKKVADAFNEFADSGAKSAAMTALTGKSAKEAAPYLKDLATETGITSKMTAEQAAQAEELQKSLRRLSVSAEAAGTSLVLSLVPGLQRTLDAMVEAVKHGDGLIGTIGGIVRALGQLSPATDLWKTEREIVTLTDEMLSTQKEIEARAGKAGKAELDALDAHAKATETRLRELQKLRGVLAGETDAFGDAKPKESDKKKLVFDPTEKLKKGIDDTKKKQKELDDAWVKSIQQQIDGLHDVGMALNDGKTGTQILADQEKAAHDLGDAYVKMIDQMMDYERATGLAANGGKSMSQTLEEQVDILGALADKVDGYGKSIADTLVNFATGAQDAKFSFADFAASVLRDIARMVTQMILIEPLLAKIKKAIKDVGNAPASSESSGNGVVGFLAGLFKGGGGELGSGAGEAFAKGGAFAAPSLSRYSNGVYNSPRAFAFASGGVFAENGPEAIMPLKRGADGKLGVDTSGSGGGVTVNVINEARAKVETKSRNDVNGNRIIEVMVKEAVGSAFRSGAFDGVMGATFGLSRQGAR